MNPTPKRLNAVEYAEQVLDVHMPWTEAQRRLDEHEKASGHVDHTKSALRAIKQELEDRKWEVTTEAPSYKGYPEGVQARRDFTKLLISGDEQVCKHEDEIVRLQGLLEDYQSQVKHHELGLYVLTARMNELGGLLSFFAAAKQAETQTDARYAETTLVHESISQHTKGNTPDE